MDQHLKPCTSIFKLLFICLILNSCMNKVYEKISYQIDRHYFNKRIIRSCGTSLIDLFEINNSIPVELKSGNFVINKISDEQVIKIIKFSKEKQKEIDSNLESFDALINKIRSISPTYFKDCEDSINNYCSFSHSPNDLTCLEMALEFFFNSKIYNSYLFPLLNEDQKKQIIEKINNQNPSVNPK